MLYEVITEAYFKVRKDLENERKFQVITKDLAVEVLGQPAGCCGQAPGGAGNRDDLCPVSPVRKPGHGIV